MGKELIGKITHFFSKINVGVIALSGELKVGDKISIERGDEIVEQVVESMQVEHKNIETAKAGDDVGLKINGVTKPGAEVYKITD